MPRKTPGPTVRLFRFGPERPTQFQDLKYQHNGDHWRIVANGYVVGPIYPTRATLLADLPRFADVYGAT